MSVDYFKVLHVTTIAKCHCETIHNIIGNLPLNILQHIEQMKLWDSW